MSMIDSGRYRLRKDWANVSIPSLVDIDEQTGDNDNDNDNGDDDVMLQNLATPLSINVHQKMKMQAAAAAPTATATTAARPRRSSLALSLFFNKSEKNQKRRSSIATTFFKRDHQKKNSLKESLANINNEKIDDSNNPDGFSSDENIQSSSPNESMKIILKNNLNRNDGVSVASTTYTDTDVQINEPEPEPEPETDPEPERNNNRGGRRSSLQMKLDRRRRKNFESTYHTPQSLRLDLENSQNMPDISTMASATSYSLGRDIGLNHTAYYPKEKRHSWWNIFIPDNIKHRSRRASQDATVISRSFDNLPVRRSKSRSVDHGLAAPFDLDMLRSKVEERFETVDRLNERKKSSMPTIPTINYTVGSRDTLTSVAARFHTTPSELTQLNRLNSSFIYPGQQLLVPDKSAQQQNELNPNNDNSDVKTLDKSSPVERKLSADNEKVLTDILESLRPGSPKPGRIERIDCEDNSNNNNRNDKADDPVITQRFLKINVRHITDGQGVVGGVLLVTPNAVMFDPNVSDPLVIEHGPESYGVIAPMELCVNAAIFLDIAHMRVSGDFASSSLTDTSTNLTDSEKQEIYYPKVVLEQKQEQQQQLEDQQVQQQQSESEAEAESQQLENQSDEQKIEHKTEASDKVNVTLTPSSIEHVAENNQKVIEQQTKEGIVTEIIVGDHTYDSNSITVIDQLEEENKPVPSSSSPTSLSMLEERRKSLLDHHWAIPSKDRSSEDEGDNESNATVDSEARGHDGHSGSSSMCGTSSTNAGNINGTPMLITLDPEHMAQLTKQTCYDSGIDIRDPITNIQPIPKKTVYSDADIVLSSDWIPPKAISSTPLSESPPRSTNQLPGFQDIGGSGGGSGAGGLSVASANVGARKKTSSVSFSVDDNNETPQSNTVSSTVGQADKNADKKNKMLKRLSYPLTWVEGLTGESGGTPTTTSSSATNSIGKSLDTESAPNTADSNQSVFSKVFSRRSSIGTFMRSESAATSQLKGKEMNKSQPKLDYRSMVSVDDKPELFVSVDKLIPRPARACPDPPLYLRLRMGKPIGRTVPLPTSVMSYGKNKLRPEYWFSVPKNRVDELYRFMNTWVPHLYGKLNEEQIKSRGFELIQDNTEWTHNDSKKSGSRSNSFDSEEIGDITRESWEVLSMSNDEYRKTSIFQTGSFDLDFPIPDLIGNTEILTEEHREKLCGHLPARAEGYSWSLVFSTSQHGFSLKSLYRKMQRLESPILIVIEDTEHNVFGALTSCALHVSDHFYGTGESLLYKFNPNFKVFHWTGENLYFIKGNPESLSIGAGDGRFGLWLDGDLNQGRSQTCSTYGNEPLAPQEDFVIKTLECWAFV